MPWGLHVYPEHIRCNQCGREIPRNRFQLCEPCLRRSSQWLADMRREFNTQRERRRFFVAEYGMLPDEPESEYLTLEHARILRDELLSGGSQKKYSTKDKKKAFLSLNL